MRFPKVWLKDYQQSVRLCVLVQISCSGKNHQLNDQHVDWCVWVVRERARENRGELIHTYKAPTHNKYLSCLKWLWIGPANVVNSCKQTNHNERKKRKHLTVYHLNTSGVWVLGESAFFTSHWERSFCLWCRNEFKLLTEKQYIWKIPKLQFIV